MNMTTILFIAVGLAMDADAVSVTRGINIRQERFKEALKIGVFFGSFQAFMPFIGWLAGLGLRDFISGVDHWIAFGLLTLIGGKMIYESLKAEATQREGSPLSLFLLLGLSIATSIDALAVGVSFAFLKISIGASVSIIGIVTFILSFIGVIAGNRVGRFLKGRIEVAGGFILIGIGVKILIEHSL